ncbi:MAG: FG-GAP-like repeat-containing protein [Chryseosolibacter sp.]
MRFVGHIFEIVRSLSETHPQRRLLAILVLVCGHAGFAQNPVISSVDRSHAATHDVVTLHGSDFGNDPSQVKVFFGASKAQIQSISNQIVQVRTPFGATFDPVRITNTTSGRTGYAPGQFFLNYSGEHGTSSDKFSVQSDFQAQSGLYDLCLCDFNDDGKPDVATASSSSNLITLFQNASTPGNINLTGQDFLINARTLHVRCGDLNGDGRPDVVLSEGSDGDRIFILTNNGGFNFSLQNIRLQGIKVKQVGIADLDLDGRPDVVVTNTGGNVVTVLPNQSSRSAIAFGTPYNLTIPQASSTDALAIGDLNADGLPEIVTSQYQADSENKLFIAVNKGSFNFPDISTISVNKAVSNIRMADLDGDAKPEIVIARLTGSDISVYRNTTSAAISFAAPLFYMAESLPVGVDFGDFDGDGKLDMAVSSIAKSVSVLNNTTATPGTATFSPVVKLNATYINRNLRNADMDGDGKPDIVFTSVDDFSGVPVPASKVSVMRNLACMVPQVTPGGPLNICTGNSVQLKATGASGVNYEWYRDGGTTPVKSGAASFLDITTSGEYRVVAVSGSCSRESNVVQVTVTTPASGLTQTDPDARSNSPVCTGNILNLQVNDVGATAYRWRGPNGFSQTVTTPSVSRQNFNVQAAGLYIVEMVTGTCVAKTDSTLVEAVSIPSFNVLYTGGDRFCSGDTKTLTITPSISSGFSYQWFEMSTGIIPEATSGTYTADASGEYYASVTPDYVGCSAKETTSVILTALAPPVAAFDAPAAGCAGSEIVFTQKSTGATGATMVYAWSFGDGSQSAATSPANTYEQPGSFEVSMNVSYDGLQTCGSTASRPIDVVAPVTAQITSSALSMCAGESVALSIDGNFISIQWNNNETSPRIDVHAAGDYRVSTLDANGCASADEITISQKTVPSLSISADREAVAAGQSVQFNAAGADVYSWSPGKTLNDSTIASPMASPMENTVYVVTGALAGGCSATASISILVNGEVLSIVVPILFSPNGDNVNEILAIEGVENYPDCSLNVFDKRGGRVFSTVGYQNNWDGTTAGTPLPEGVYYYVFGCPNKKSATGTVTLIR